MGSAGGQFCSERTRQSATRVDEATVRRCEGATNTRSASNTPERQIPFALPPAMKVMDRSDAVTYRKPCALNQGLRQINLRVAHRLRKQAALRRQCSDRGHRVQSVPCVLTTCTRATFKRCEPSAWT